MNPKIKISYFLDIWLLKPCAAKGLQNRYEISLTNGINQERGTKEFLKHLDVPWNTMKVIIKKVEKMEHNIDITRTGHPTKINEMRRWKLIREAAKRHMATLKVLQEYLASTGHSLHVRTVSHILCLGYEISWLDEIKVELLGDNFKRYVYVIILCKRWATSLQLGLGLYSRFQYKSILEKYLIRTCRHQKAVALASWKGKKNHLQTW